jgi:hypothetical protein
MPKLENALADGMKSAGILDGLTSAKMGESVALRMAVFWMASLGL